MNIRTTSSIWLIIGFLSAASMLHAAPAKSLDDAVRDLESGRDHERQEAMRKLVAGGEAGRLASEKCLVTGTSESRLQCLRILGRIRNSESLPRVRKTADSDKEWLVRREAVATASRFRNNQAIRIIEDRLADSHPGVQIAAIQYLSMNHNKSANPQIKKLLSSRHKLVALNAALALAQNNDDSGRDIALAAIGSSISQEMSAGLLTLGYIGRESDQDRIESINNDPKVRLKVKYDAVFALRHMKLMRMPQAQQLRELETAISDIRMAVRFWAVGELMTHGGPEARAILSKVAGEKNNPGRIEAIRALKAMEQQG